MKNYTKLIFKKSEKRILILFLLVATGATAQIGVGTRTPHQDAMLEVASTNKGLLLPRVALTSITSPAPLSNHVAGMSVYNTATTGDVTTGYYYSDGTKWIKLAVGTPNTYTGSTSTVLNGTSFERAALTGDVTADANSNATTIASNAVTTTKIANNAVTTDKITDGAVTVSKLNLGTATTGQVLKYDGSTWAPAADAGTTYTGSTSTVLNGTSFERAALTGDVTADANSNATTIASNAVTTTKIANNAVTTDKITDGAVTVSKLNLGTATTGQVLKYDGSTWAPAADAGLTATTVVNGITAGALTTTVNGVAASPVTLPVADGSETKVIAGTNVTVTGAGTTTSPYVMNAAGASDATTTTNGIVRLAGDLSGTADAPTVANNAVTSAKILDGTIATADLADASITAAKLTAMGASSGQVLKYDGTTWAPAADAGLTATTVVNGITAGALTTTVNGVAASPVTLPVADGSETKVIAGTNVTVTGAGTTTSPYVVTSAVENAADTPSTAITGSTTQVAVSSTNVQGAIGDLATAVKTAGNSNIYAADGSLAGNREITQGENTLAFTSSATTGTSHFTVDGTTLNVDAVNNRLGVGTATPGEALHVVGNVRSSSLASGTGNGNKMVIASETGVLSTQDIPVTATNLVTVTTATYTSTSTNNSILVDVPTGGATVTLPAASANNGKILTIKKVDDDTDVLTLSTAVKITPSESFTTLNYTAALTIQSDGTNWWLIN